MLFRTEACSHARWRTERLAGFLWSLCDATQDKATLEVINQRLANTALVPKTMTTAYLPTFAACRSSLSEYVTTPSVCAPK